MSLLKACPRLLALPVVRWYLMPMRLKSRPRLKKQVILVRIETSPEDIHGMNAAEGILTARGGMTSHAAVVARGMGKCCVSGCSAIKIDYEKTAICH